MVLGKKTMIRDNEFIIGWLRAVCIHQESCIQLSVFTAWDINGGKLQILQLIDNDRSKKALQI